MADEATVEQHKFTAGRVMGARLCEAWGLDPHRVAGISIRFPIREPAVATIEYRPGEETLELLLELRPGEGSGA